MLTVTLLFISPILWTISIPLTLFAALTTSLAFITLLLRALMVYMELAAALIRNQFGHDKEPSDPWILSRPTHLATAKHTRQKSRRGSATSSSTGSITPREHRPSSGLGMYGGQTASRDFEGVGGWRIPGPSDDDLPWLNMNSRLELPTTVEGRQRNHHRSQTSGSLTSIPFTTKSPARSRARTPTSTRVPGTTSPEEYFGSRVSSKSTTALDAANIGRALLRHQPSHSSGSSGNSAHTLHMNISST